MAYVGFVLEQTINQKIKSNQVKSNQSINQSISQSINQSINQSDLNMYCPKMSKDWFNVCIFATSCS